MRGPVILELPYPSDEAARRALLRCVYRRAARALRDELGYPGAARALEDRAAALRTPEAAAEPDDPDDDEATVIDVMPFGLACAGLEAFEGVA